MWDLGGWCNKVRPCAWHTQIYPEEICGCSKLTPIAMRMAGNRTGKQFYQVNINRAYTIEASGALGVEGNRTI